MLTHGTALLWNGRGLLLTGPSGCGKSDLALRLIGSGAALIADDLVVLERDGGRLIANRPTAAPARLMVRDIGIIDPASHAERVPLSLCVLLDPEMAARASEPQLAKAGPWHGLFLPQITLQPFEASIIAKLELALMRFGH